MLVSTGFVLTGVINTILGPILPLLAARWTLSDSTAGYFFVTQFLGSIAGVFASSILLPRRGFRFSIGLAYLLMAMGVIGLGFPEWRYALLATLIFGFGLGTGIPATNLFVSQVRPHRRASSLSILNLYWGLGAAAGPFALSVAQRRNHVPVFLSFLAGVLLLLTLGLAFAKLTDLASAASPPAEQGDGRPAWHSVAVLGGMFFLYVAIEASVGGWIATLVERTGARGSWVLAPSLFWGGLLAGRGIAPVFLRRTRERTLAVASLALAGAGICVLALAPHWEWNTTAGCVVGLGLAAVFPITIASLSRFDGMEKRIAGPMFALAGLGGAVMPWLVGFLSTSFGTLRAGLVAPLLATGFLLWLHVIGHDEVRVVLRLSQVRE